MKDNYPFDLKKYIEVFETIGDPISVQDRNYKILYQNSPHYGLFGRHIGEYCYKAYESKNETCSGCPLALTFEDGAFHKVERRRSVDGGFLHVEIVSSPIHDSKGNIVAGFETGRDITARKEMVNKIIKAKKDWETTFDSISDVITIQDKQMRLIRANQATCNQLGVDYQDILGKFCYKIFRRASEPCAGCPVVTCLHDSKIHTTEVEYKEMGKTFLVSAFPIMENDGTFSRVVHITKDITEKKNLEDQLRQSHKMEAIGTLAGGIAHDFNNILMAILGYGNIVQENLPAESQLWDDMAEVIKAGNRAKELVAQILSFSRQTKHDMIPLQLDLIVKETLKLLRSTIPTTIEIRQNIDSDCGFILADPIQMHQVFMNLCTNAYHAMRKNGGLLTVSLQKIQIDCEDYLPSLGLKPGNYIKLGVIDTGHGIEKKMLDRIFEPYFTTKQAGEGTGLGLSIAHGIIKDHGGHITVYSEPGRGTTFYIYLPCIDEKAVTEKEAVLTPAKRGNERIMIVDDEPEIALLFDRTIKSLGYQVVAYTDSMEALQAFRMEPDGIDMVITDTNMPRMNGIQLASELLIIKPELPIILSTGFSELIDDAALKKMGIRKFINKPISKREIAEAISTVLDEKK